MVLGDESVSVKHSKTQVVPSWVYNESLTEFEEAVSFTWELVITFDPAVTKIQELTVDIISGSLQDGLVPKEKAEYLKTKISGLEKPIEQKETKEIKEEAREQTDTTTTTPTEPQPEQTADGQ